jgi:RNA polymerase-binding transcription factor DksA
LIGFSRSGWNPATAARHLARRLLQVKHPKCGRVPEAVMSKLHLTPPELDQFREQLRSLVARVKGKVSELEAEATRPAASTSVNPDEQPAHEADPGVRVAEESVALTILGSEEQILAESTAALARLEAGTFGQCEKCGHAIGKARLKAVPYARHCIHCAT